MHGDQTGRDGGTKKVKEENETLDDLERTSNEDGRGCCYHDQPFLKTNPEALAADRAVFEDKLESTGRGTGSRPKPIKKRRCATRLQVDDSEKRADHRYDGVENRSCEPPDPGGLAALPSFSNHWRFPPPSQALGTADLL